MARVVSAQQGEVLLGKLSSANLNSTADQLISLIAGKKRITRIVCTNPSVTPTLAAGGIYVDTNKAGTKLVDTTQLYTALVAALKLNLTLLNDYTTVIAAYLSLTTANGTACTCDIYIFGEILP